VNPDPRLVLLAQPEVPWQRGALPGGSYWDRVYTRLNQALAACVLLLLSPLLLLIAALVLWGRDGPLTYGHYRVGQGGQLFRCLKFRTMVPDADRALADLLARDPAARAEWERDQKLRRDPRVTAIGRVLRKTSLDELPQLLNILRGEMHFVGPRPVTLGELQRYAGHKRHYLSVKPGLTGLWQISGRNLTTFPERVALDARYVERRNPLFDLWIVLRTVRVVATGHGAH
jgi:exopolysaccharide production protein ExoY